MQKIFEEDNFIRSLENIPSLNFVIFNNFLMNNIHNAGHVRNLLSSSAVPTSTTMTATKDHRSTHVAAGKFLRKGPDTLQVAGSSLPDCSHACGSCTPCRLVMVSFVCASIEEAETCPMAYKCMCNNKSYPVP